MEQDTYREEWDIVVGTKASRFRLNLRSVWAYRDLIMLFVKRDFVSIYKQTILGSAWHFVQPVIMTIFFTFLFSAKFSNSTSLPFPIFNLAGLTVWNFFAATLNKNSTIFVSNAAIFGKVYFPRLTVPIANLISSFYSLLIQLGLFIILMLYYVIFQHYSWQINYKALVFLPFVFIYVGLFGMFWGLIISAFTTKYRDLIYLLAFFMQFVMYISDVAFPINGLINSQWYYLINPVALFIKLFKYIMLSQPFNYSVPLALSVVYLGCLLFFSVLVFNKVEKSFVDTV